MRLNSLELHRFKAFEQAGAALAPLTVFIGPNNAGKSSLLQSPALIAQSTDENVLRTSGAMVDLGNAVQDLVHGRPAPGVGWEITLRWQTPVAFERDKQPLPIDVEFIVRSTAEGYGFETTANATINSVLDYPVTITAEWGLGAYPHVLVTANYVADHERHLPALREEFQAIAVSPWRWDIRENLDQISRSGDESQSARARAADILKRVMPLFSGGITEQLKLYHYVGADRHVARSSYPLADSPVQFPRSAEEVINSLAYNDALRDRVSERMQSVFGYGLDTSLAPGKQLSLVSTGPKIAPRNAVNMGAGFTQFAWIALHLELSKVVNARSVPSLTDRQAVVAVEEPELHLHPRLQPDAARLLLDYTMEGGQILCTTQSEHFLLAVLELVLDGSLSSDDLAVYYVESGTLDRLEVDERGRLAGGLRGFMEATEERLRRQIDLINASARLDS